MTYFKDDIIAMYAEAEGITKVEASKRVNKILDIITDALVAGNDVKINNFFNFFYRELQPKVTKNPVSGEELVIPKTKSIHAKMTKPLKDRVQGKK